MRIHPVDAGPRGVKDGDIVKMYNDRGVVLLIAHVTELTRPGTVHSYESCGDYEALGEQLPHRGAEAVL